MSKFWIEYPDIMNELENVKNIIKKSIKTREKFVEQSILPMVDIGGKMLRPAFLLLAGKFGEYDEEKIHNLAAVIEILHIATLVHDDIIDDSKMRRGLETIQSRYGKDYAVYIGDYLFCQCLTMMSEYEYTMENLKNISKVMSRICLSEISQYHFRYTTNIKLRNYLRIISGKTAALFALSLYVGARESKCSDNVSKLLGKVGYNVGMAFQITDDLLDYMGQTETLGKNIKRDLISGYYTLPLIYALEKDENKRIFSLLNNSELKNEDINKIIELVEEYGGIEKTKKVADRYTKRALKYADELPDCRSKEILKEVILKLLKRKY